VIDVFQEGVGQVTKVLQVLVLVVIFSFYVITVPSLGLAQVKAPNVSAPKKYPTLSGVMVVTEQVRKWNQQDWNRSLEKMKQIKVDTIVLQYSAQETADEKLVTYFPSENAVSDKLQKQQIKLALEASKKLHLQVYIGLQVNEDKWFANYASDERWLQHEARVSQEVAQKIWKTYHTEYSNTIAGWYLPFEISSGSHFDGITEQKSIVNHYLKPVSEYLKSKTDQGKQIMTSPLMYPNSNQTENNKLQSSWYGTWKYLLEKTKIDIVAPQDGIGWQSSTTEDIEPWFKTTRQAIDEVNKIRIKSTYYPQKVQLWDNAENYNMNGGDANLPMSVNLFISNIKAVEKYVDKIISFSLHRLDPVGNHEGGAQNIYYYNAYRYYAFHGNTPVSNSHLLPPVHLTATVGRDGLSARIIMQPRGDTEKLVKINKRTAKSVSFNSSQKIAGYKIFRKEKNSAWFEQIMEIPQSNASIVVSDVQLNPGTTYVYLVKSFDAFGLMSSYGASVEVRIPDTIRTGQQLLRLENTRSIRAVKISGVSNQNENIELTNSLGKFNERYLESYTRGEVYWLIDGEKANVDSWWDSHWDGFQNLKSYTVEVVLAQESNIHEIAIDFLESRDVGIRLPKKVLYEIAQSDTGEYSLLGEATKPNIPQNLPHRVFSWTYRTINLTESVMKVKRIKITVEPEYYNSAWNYIDEIQLFSMK